ncbi:unnamed protein product [Caenorhabditis nigoni]
MFEEVDGVPLSTTTPTSPVRVPEPKVPPIENLVQGYPQMLPLYEDAVKNMTLTTSCANSPLTNFILTMDDVKCIPEIRVEPIWDSEEKETKDWPPRRGDYLLGANYDPSAQSKHGVQDTAHYTIRSTDL